MGSLEIKDTPTGFEGHIIDEKGKYTSVRMKEEADVVTWAKSMGRMTGLGDITWGDKVIYKEEAEQV